MYSFFFHTRRMCTILCVVFAWIVLFTVTSRDSEIGRVCTYRLIDGWRFHNFLANATMIAYVTKITLSSVVLFGSAIFMTSVKTSVKYCSCSSVGMRSINGSTAFMVSDIKNTQTH